MQVCGKVPKSGYLAESIRLSLAFPHRVTFAVLDTIDAHDKMPNIFNAQTRAATDSTTSLPSPLNASSNAKHTTPNHTYERVPDTEDDFHPRSKTPPSLMQIGPRTPDETDSSKCDSTQGCEDHDKGAIPAVTATETSACLGQDKLEADKRGVETARPLNGLGYREWSSMALDVLLCLLPIAFIGQYSGSIRLLS